MSFFSSISSLFTGPSSSTLRSTAPQRHQRQRSRHPQGVLDATRDAFGDEAGYDYREPGSVSRGGSPGLSGSGGGRGYREQSFNSSPSTSRQNSASGDFSYPPNLGRAPADSGRVGGYDVVSGGAIGAGVRRGVSRESSLGLAPDSSAIMRDRSSTPLPPNSLAYYPPLNHTWNRIKTSLHPLPELLDTLNYPVDPSTLHLLETTIGITLPASVRDSYLCVDGQDPSAECREGLVYGLSLLSLEDAMREWSFWRKVAQDPSSGRNPSVLALQSSIPPGWIKPLYASPGWIPLIADKCGNYIGVDLDPQEDGGWGQVICFGREFDRKCVLWRGEGEGGWGRWLAGFAEELEAHDGWEFTGGDSNTPESGDEEDEIGYSSYFDDPSGSARGEDSAGGGGLRLTGEYRGWSVLAAFWDRSVKRWEEMGLGVPDERLVEEQRLFEERERERKRSSVQGLGFAGMRLGEGEARVAIPVVDDPEATIDSLPPPTPGPQSSLLEPAHLNNQSDELPASSLRLRELQAEAASSSASGSTPLQSPAPLRLITPVSPTIPSSSEPRVPSNLAQSTASSSSPNGLLSPPTSSPIRKPRVPSAPPPAPMGLDLPTRADVQAAQAVALAEASGLRGGWVMSMEAARSGLTGTSRGTSYSARSSLSSAGGGEDGEASEMVDIDLEAGQKKPFGSPKYAEEVVPLEHSTAPAARTPSPLSMMDYSSEATPRQPSSSRLGAESTSADSAIAPPLASFPSADERPPLKVSTEEADGVVDTGEEETPTAIVPSIRFMGSSAAPSPVGAGFKKVEFETVEV